MKHHLNLIKKLSSRKGMSMTFGLLLLLVALTVGSVVLTAGTAAAGRNIRSAEADARYYAVMSAAELMRDMFDGKTCSSVRTKTVTITTNTPLTDNGTEDNGRAGKKEDQAVEYTAPDIVPGKEGDTLIKEIGTELLWGKTIPADDAMTEDDFARAAAADFQRIERSFTVTSDINDSAETDPLKVSVSLTVTDDGTVTVLLTSGTEEGKMYTAEMTFTAQFAEDTNDLQLPATREVSGTKGSYLETKTEVKMTEKRASVTWTYAGTRTVREK